MKLSLSQTVIALAAIGAACFLGYEHVIASDGVTGIITGISGIALGAKAHALGVASGQNGNGH